ncbi:MAG: phage holin family protein [Cytophagales bacterium]|nr:phage holin family protein [Cytophagales bacterium]
MKEKIESWLKLDQLVDNLTGYVDAKVRLTKLQIQEEFSKGLAKLLVASMLFLMLFWVMLFGIVTVALFLGEYLESYALGFAIVTAIALLKAFFLFWQRERITNYVMKQAGKQLAQNTESTNENKQQPAEH